MRKYSGVVANEKCDEDDKGCFKISVVLYNLFDRVQEPRKTGHYRYFLSLMSVMLSIFSTEFEVLTKELHKRP